MLDSESQAFVFSVDELGSYLVVGGDELVIGHSRAASVDLPFLADVGGEHARLDRRLSFRGGVAWSITALRGERVLVGGQTVEGAHILQHGHRVELGKNLSFRYQHPDPGSTTAVLELESGAECLGNRAVVLFGEGRSGQLRLGSNGSCHLCSSALRHEVQLRRTGGQLWLDGERSEAFKRLRGEPDGVLPGGADGAIGFSLPLSERIDLELAPGSASGPPFGVALRPL